LKRADDGLVPADALSEDYFGKWNTGEVRYAEIRKVRNPAHHRKAFAVLQFAVDNSDYPSVDLLLETLKIAVGHVDEIRILHKNKVYYRTKSISFANMGQEEFNDFYTKMLDALTEMTGISQDVLEEGGH